MSEARAKRMTGMEREKVIATYIRTGKAPEGYDVHEDEEAGTFRVRTTKQLTEREKLALSRKRTQDKLDKLNRLLSEMKDEPVPEPESSEPAPKVTFDEDVVEPESEPEAEPVPKMNTDQPKLTFTKRKSLNLK
jgi:hypothetical protein